MCLRIVSAVMILVALTKTQEITIANKICSKKGSDAPCQQLARDNTLACQENLHRVDCLLNINNSLAHIGRISGEEAFLGANLVSDQVYVIAEIIERHPPPQTVVIIKNEIPSTIIDLKGKKLCHPGFNHDKLFSPLMLQELELTVINQEKDKFCSNLSDTTLLEKHIRFISEYFGDSCRPGLWTQNEALDQDLKKKYSSLCNLCDGCKQTYKDAFNFALQCLAENNGDVAITTLSDAQRFFNTSFGNQQRYKYLCKNNTSSSFSSPCTWTNQLNDLVVASRDKMYNVVPYLTKYLSSKLNGTQSFTDSSDVISRSLIEILDLSGRFTKIKFLQPGERKSIKDYVNERRPVPTLAKSTQCEKTIKWCTYSDPEQEKCKWLSQAALNRAIQPVVECTRTTEGDDELVCLDDIKKKVADVVVASADFAYISLKKGLSALAYPETDTRNVSVILAVKASNNTSITKFEDLKGKSACLPRFGGKEFVAFVDRIKSISKQQNKDYGKIFNDFVGKSCVPGLRDNLIQEAVEYLEKDELCDLCVPAEFAILETASMCNADEKNRYYDNLGAIHCLDEHAGDFAVITRPNDYSNFTNLTVICKDNTLSPSPGLDVSTNCALNILINSEVVSRIDNPKNPDIILALYEFEKWFGVDLDKPFEVFNAFNNTKDLLFQDSTPGLTFDYSNQYVKNYHDLLENTKRTSFPSSGSVFNLAFSICVLAMTIFLIH